VLYAFAHTKQKVWQLKMAAIPQVQWKRGLCGKDTAQAVLVGSRVGITNS